METTSAPTQHPIVAAPSQTDVSRARVVTRTTELVTEGSRLIGRRAPQPRIAFDLRGQAAGQFRVDRNGEAAIRYNLALLVRHAADFIVQTVPHEVAHYLVYLRFGRHVRPHGPEWQQLMRVLGADPRRCHDFDVDGLKARRLRRHAYHCRCGEHALTSIRHHRVLRGARYVCRMCGEALRPGDAPAPNAET
jgi:SprT protein